MAYEFGPDGAFISPPITLTLSLGATKLPEGTLTDSLALAYWDGKQWIKGDSKKDSAAGTFTTQISHFSQWALISGGHTSAKIQSCRISSYPQIRLQWEIRSISRPGSEYRNG